jgi:serine/threonine-protein kinase
MPDLLHRLETVLAGRYAIERELGRGGTATVFLARDLRHRRLIALKVLRPEVGAVIGSERFLREIEIAAGLTHPHILPIHDSGDADGLLYFVMPYVPGESLRARLAREGQLPVEDALRISRDIGAALSYAHAQGFVHRDIKPENILIEHGEAVVADFGLARALEAAADSRITGAGFAMGTPAYMSPEQAAGPDVDARADLYSLGCVLYEMLTGEPPFTGPTAQAVVARAITDQPAPIRARRPTVPPPVESAVLTALQKLPADRFASAAEFGRALAAERAVGISATIPAGPRVSSWLRRPAAGWLFGLLALGLGGLLAWRGEEAEREASPAVVRFGVDLPEPARLSPISPALVFSPDGRTLVISAGMNGDNRLYLLRLDTGRPVPVPGTHDARPPAFSPDGRWLAFVQESSLVKVAVAGGTPIPLIASSGLGVAWIDDRTLVFNRKYNEGLWRVPAQGGKPERLTSPDTARGELGHWWPQVLPGGRTVLYTAYGSPPEQSQIDVLDLKTGERKVLVSGGVYGRYLADGRLVFFRDGNMLSAPLDVRRLKLTGEIVPVLQHVAIGRLAALPAFGVSSDGTLAWVADSEYITPKRLFWVDPAGHESAALAEPGPYSQVRLSPNQRKAAFALETPTPDVWVADLATGIRTRITGGPGVERLPVWSPDGRRVFYQQEHGAFDIYARGADAGDSAVAIATSRFDKYPGSVTPDGRGMVAMEDSLHERIVLFPLGTGGKPRELLAGPADRQDPTLSPDGRWLAYASNESGRWQLRVAPFGGSGGGSRQVAEGGINTDPVDRAWIRWANGGRELLYLTGDSVMKVAFDPRTGESGTAGLELRTLDHVEDVSRDGRRLLVTRPVLENGPRRISFVLHWLREVDGKPVR